LIGNSKKHIVAGTNELVQNAKNWANLDDGFSPFGYKPNILAFSTRRIERQSEKAYYFCTQTVLN
jgi:hypothetical protein